MNLEMVKTFMKDDILKKLIQTHYIKCHAELVSASKSTSYKTLKRVQGDEMLKQEMRLH